MNPDRERDLDAEIEAHLAIERDRNVERGMTPEEARYAAARKFGSVALAKESCREARGLAWLDRLGQDVRYAFRTFRRAPGFTAVAVLSLALGISATTAIFSAVNGLLLRPLPYRDPDRLVTIGVTNRKLQLGLDELPVTAPLLRYWRERATSCEAIAAFTPIAYNLTGAGDPVRIRGARVTANLFGLLGVKPQLGRGFRAEEDQPGRDGVVLISDLLWKRSFGANSAILGRKLLLDGVPFTVIGVMPPGFQYPGNGDGLTLFGPVERPDVWKPLALSTEEQQEHGNFTYQAIARLKPGVGVERARAEFGALAEQYVKGTFLDIQFGWELLVSRLDDKVASRFRTAVLVLFGAVALLLLIACANVANLLLARAARRSGEMAVRLALGAGRLRLMRQLLTESVLLSLAGGALGVMLASGILGVFPSLAPASTPRLEAVAMDVRVLAFALAVSVCTGLLFGLAPALEAFRPAWGAGSKHGGRRTRTRQALVVVEVALSLVLITGASLLIKSFVVLVQTPAGFRAENVVTMLLPLTAPAYRDFVKRVLFMRELIASVEAQPGVQAAGAIDMLPLTGENNISDISVEGAPRDDVSQVPIAEFRNITPEYFRAMGITVRAGRALGEHEGAPVAIVSRTAARRFWPGVPDPTGRRFKRGHEPETPYLTVVGIVDDVRSSGLDVVPRPQVYQPYTHNNNPEMSLAVRTSSDPSRLIAAIRAEIRRIDKDVPAMDVRVMREVVARSVSGRRFQMLLVAVFAALALALALVGIYGVISYSAAQRTHEIGLRMALGALPRDTLALVLKEGMALAAAGVAIGAGAAFAVTPVLRGFLYGVSAADAGVFAVSALVLLATAFVACYLPARRAAATDPLVALRYE